MKLRKPGISALLALALTTPAALAATITFTDDFESYAVSSYNQPLSKWRAGEVKTPHALKIVSDANGGTGKTILFEYRNTDVLAPSNTVKADLAGNHVGMNTEQYVGFDINLSEVSAVSTKKSPLIFQYHMGISGFPPPVGLSVTKNGTKQYLSQNVNVFPNGTKNSRIRNPQVLMEKPEGWVRVIMYTKFNSSNSGVLKTFINGQQVGQTYNGQLGLDGAGIYPRIGIYQANDKKVTTDYAPVNKVKLDNYKMGATMAEVQ